MSVIGIDFGATFTKAVKLEGKRIVSSKIGPSSNLSYSTLVQDIQQEFGGQNTLFFTGGQSKSIAPKFDALVVDEVEALGRGTLALESAGSAIVASLGTGTCILHAGNEISHLLGSGVGGGTIMGLAKALINVDDFLELEELARTGNAHGVNLTVGDILGSGIGILESKTTASNLCKVAGSKREDVAAGIFCLAGEVIASIIGLQARNLKESDLLVCGLLGQSKLIQTIINKVMAYFSLNVHYPKNGEYAAAYGAALSA